MIEPKKRFITCGMYSFTDSLRSAWQALFENFLMIYDPVTPIDQAILFETDFDLLRNPQMFIGHTCGYPLMRFLHADCHPVCVPIFDVDGCDGSYYSSHLVVSKDTNIINLSDCRNRVAAINGRDSNSGMNVLRHAVAKTGHPAPYFSAVLETGSHFNSLKAVANREADIAAIDCVSFELFNDEWPELVTRIRSIGYCEATCGLPFVVPKANAVIIDPQSIADAMNIALTRLPETHRQRLHLSGFKTVSLDAYQTILDIETQAEQAGYITLS